ncbi:MAG: SRPBCC domain-containing protein [Deltaproteobacteria bacterium]|nr:SRPBCC domain-containing protein [Deltaproteobacteria bacterium]
MSPPTRDPLGEVRRDGDRWSLRYVRLLRHSPEKVWAAITRSEHLAHWLPCDILGERRAGARVELPFWPETAQKYGLTDPPLLGEIRVWDPPHVFEWTWDVDLLRFELAPEGEGTRLTFTTWLGDSDGRRRHRLGLPHLPRSAAGAA